MNAAQVCSDRRYTWHHSQEECQAAADAGYPYGFGSNLTVFTGTGESVYTLETSRYMSGVFAGSGQEVA